MFSSYNLGLTCHVNIMSVMVPSNNKGELSANNQNLGRAPIMS